MSNTVQSPLEVLLGQSIMINRVSPPNDAPKNSFLSRSRGGGNVAPKSSRATDWDAQVSQVRKAIEADERAFQALVDSLEQQNIFPIGEGDAGEGVVVDSRRIYQDSTILRANRKYTYDELVKELSQPCKDITPIPGYLKGIGLSISEAGINLAKEVSKVLNEDKNKAVVQGFVDVDLVSDRFSQADVAIANERLLMRYIADKAIYIDGSLKLCRDPETWYPYELETFVVDEMIEPARRLFRVLGPALEFRKAVHREITDRLDTLPDGRTAEAMV